MNHIEDGTNKKPLFEVRPEVRDAFKLFVARLPERRKDLSFSLSDKPALSRISYPEQLLLTEKYEADNLSVRSYYAGHDTFTLASQLEASSGTTMLGNIVTNPTIVIKQYGEELADRTYGINQEQYQMFRWVKNVLDDQAQHTSFRVKDREGVVQFSTKNGLLRHVNLDDTSYRLKYDSLGNFLFVEPSSKANMSIFHMTDEEIVITRGRSKFRYPVHVTEAGLLASIVRPQTVANMQSGPSDLDRSWRSIPLSESLRLRA